MRGPGAFLAAATGRVTVLARDGLLLPAAGFARASVGRSVAANGLLASADVDAPRREHDPLTGAVRGLLVEPARTNIMLAGAAMTDAVWIGAAVSASGDTVTGPDGTTAADTVTESTASAVHSLYQNGLSYQAGQPHTLSVFAKSNGRERLQLVMPSTAFGATKSAVFDLIAGTVVYVEGGADHRITPFPNGWVRCAVTATATAGGTSNAHFRLRDTGGSSVFAGDGASGVHLWAAQLEVGSGASSPIVTAGAAVTRAADLATWTPAVASDLCLVGTMLSYQRIPIVSNFSSREMVLVDLPSY
jgi:hypothetical protein